MADLASPDANVAALAALEIATSGDTALKARSIEPLGGLLRHRDPLVRSAAARALEEITGTRGDFQAFRDPFDQREAIRAWQDMAARQCEAPP